MAAAAGMNQDRKRGLRQGFFDKELADRVRSALAERTDVDEKKMFGGLASVVNTHVDCGMIGAT